MIENFIFETSFMPPAETPNGRTERIGHLLNFVLDNYKGNIIEIGAGTGETTKVMLEKAKKFDRNVLVIDPWETLENQPAGYGQYAYRDFVDRTKEYTNLIVCKMPSYFKEAEKYLVNNGPYAFAFVDGLQLKENVLSDLFLMSAYNVEVICVDDINRESEISQVPAAVAKFLQGNNKYRLVETREDLMECYLIKN